MARMSVGACCNFHVKTIQYITDATPAALHIEGKMPGYTSVVTTLSSLVKRIDKSFRIFNAGDRESFEKTVAALSGENNG